MTGSCRGGKQDAASVQISSEAAIYQRNLGGLEMLRAVAMGNLQTQRRWRDPC